MSFQGFCDCSARALDSQVAFGVGLMTVFWVAVIAIVAFVLERVITRYVRKFAKRARLEPGVFSNLVLKFRILILIVALASIFNAWSLKKNGFGPSPHLEVRLLDLKRTS